jgi:hypothetical protein
MIWPRGFVGAAAFWGYNASVDPRSAAFASSIWRLNDGLIARGAKTCPTHCSCDQLSACGKPYITTPPPAAGARAHVAPCSSAASARQRWVNASGELKLAANTSLCLRPPPTCASVAECYPLVLEACAARPFAGWVHDATSEVRVRADSAVDPAGRGVCIDLAGGTQGVGTYTCGSSADYQQPNQHWSVDAQTGLIGALSAGAGPGAKPEYAGMCLGV